MTLTVLVLMNCVILTNHFILELLLIEICIVLY